MKTLYCPGESWKDGLHLETAHEVDLLRRVAERLGLPFRETDAKVFLGRGKPEPRVVLPAKGPALKERMREGDLHAVIDGGQMAVYNRGGTLLWRCEARTEGVYGPGAELQGGDTPPGLYRCGKVTWTRSDEPELIWRAYGHVFVDLEEQEDQERRRGRAGVGVHGGGSALDSPLADKQGWAPTHGCVRVQNVDARRFGHLVDTTHQAGNDVWVTVL